MKASAGTNALFIDATFFRERVEREGPMPMSSPEELLRYFMYKAIHQADVYFTWLTNEDDQFKAAVIAASYFMNEDDQQRVHHEILVMRSPWLPRQAASPWTSASSKDQSRSGCNGCGTLPRRSPS